jgi:hypothetical protein
MEGSRRLVVRPPTILRYSFQFSGISQRVESGFVHFPATEPDTVEISLSNRTHQSGLNRTAPSWTMTSLCVGRVSWSAYVGKRTTCGVGLFKQGQDKNEYSGTELVEIS